MEAFKKIKGAGKERLDRLLVEQGLTFSRQLAQALILEGAVYSGPLRLEKPGVRVSRDLPIQIKARRQGFVSRGGFKLEHAIEKFHVPVKGRVCLDIGASTGGFTHCLLKHGAEHVIALDVGWGQLDSSLQKDGRVTSVEGMNARFLDRERLISLSPLAEKIELITVDVSFISLRKIIENLSQRLMGCEWVCLFKPQFEVRRKFVKKGGIVAESAVVELALREFEAFMKTLGLMKRGGPEKTPITGKKSGNVEYLFYYV